LTLADTDSQNMVGATVSITGNFQDAEDTLAFANTPTIFGSYSNGTLTLSGTDSLANYQAALRTVTYTNASDGPSTLTRSVSFRVTDDTTTESPAGTRQVTIAVSNDPPTITTSESAAAYTENQPAVP